mgnify:FL=1
MAEVSPQSQAAFDALTPMRSTGQYDWLRTYDAARAGAYGDISDPLSVYNRILKDAGSDFEAAKKAGIIGEDGSVNWKNAPAMGPAGFNMPANAQWAPTGGRGGQVDPWTMQPLTHGQGGPFTGTGVYHDPIYGDMVLAQNRAPNSTSMNLARMGATAAFMGPMAATFAPMIGGALGLGSSMNPLIAGLIKGIPGLAQGGGMGNLLSMLGGFAGGATGIPGGSFVGGQAGSYLGMSPQQRAFLQHSLFGH